jgi:hypothetical protein
MLLLKTTGRVMSRSVHHLSARSYCLSVGHLLLMHIIF